MLKILFKPSDEHSDSLVQWMQETIASVRPDYEATKAKLFRTIGYEEGYGEMKIQFAEGHVRRNQRFFLGSRKA